MIRDLCKDLIHDLSRDLVGTELGPNYEMPIGKAVNRLPALEQFERRRLVASQWPILFRVTDVRPAVVECGFQPHAGQPVAADYLAVFVDGPGATAERNDPCTSVFEQAL